MTTTTTPTPAGKADQLVIRGTLLHLRAIMAAEGHARQAQNPSPALEGKAAEMTANLKGMETELNPAIDALMTGRLMAGRRQTPLLELTDTNRTLAKVFAGEKMSGATQSTMDMSRVVLNTAIGSRISFLRAISPDLYDAFWTFAQALASEAGSSKSLPSQVVELRGGRIAIYRACMTPESWRLRTREIIALMSGVSASTLFGGLTSAVEDDTVAALLSEALSDIDTAMTPGREAEVRRIKTYYAKLGREIWEPASA